MWVLKLGGSLDSAGHLGDWLHAVAHIDVPLIIVPGGGAFADSVRAAQHRWPVTDARAHAMAVLAMEQMAHLICGLEPALLPAQDVFALPHVDGRSRPWVWFPRHALLEDRRGLGERVPADWGTTSDSLAAMLARRLDAKGLALVKSAPVAGASPAVEQLQEAGVLDRAFGWFGARCRCPVWLLQGRRPERLPALLHGDDRGALRLCFTNSRDGALADAGPP